MFYYKNFKKGIIKLVVKYFFKKKKINIKISIIF